MPALDDRAADNWEALLGIAELAGARWRDLARAAAEHLSGYGRGEQNDTLGELLLADVRQVFDTSEKPHLPARSLLNHLLAMHDRPWAEAVRGKALTPHQLGRRLGRFGVRSRTVREGDTTDRSYVRADFDDAFARYLPPPTDTSGTSPGSFDNPNASGSSQPSPETDPLRPSEQKDFAGVTDVTASDADEEAHAANEREAIQVFGS
jgi:putative DNA primase/helicase